MSVRRYVASGPTQAFEKNKKKKEKRSYTGQDSLFIITCLQLCRKCHYVIIVILLLAPGS